MANKSDWAARREQMRRDGMRKSGPGREWLSQEDWDKVVEHERLLASARQDLVLDRKPSTYRLKTKRRA